MRFPPKTVTKRSSSNTLIVSTKELSQSLVSVLVRRRRVRQLLERTHLPFPPGTVSPRKVIASSTVILRDARVKAFVLKRAGGRCESCAAPAPFKTTLGLDYLEVHHMKTLAQGGSDRVQNAIALCPNCHRALHYASNAVELANRVYKRVTQLIPE
jgi:predicted restriction endonuclease